MMWSFTVILLGSVLASFTVEANSAAESRARCIAMLNTAYTTHAIAFDENPYGIANNTGTIYRRHEWEFKCVR
jgi:hypothetical protein